MTATDDGTNTRILVIDDTREIHGSFRRILCRPRRAAQEQVDALEAALFGSTSAPAAPASTTFAMDSAYQGQEGLALLREARAAGRPYALAFVDMRMPPGWDGVETISHLWAEDPDLQVVICTAYSDQSWSDVLRALGDRESLLILKKPFDNIEVAQMASALTRKWAFQQQLRTRMDDLEAMVQKRTRSLEELNEQLQREMSERARMEGELRLAQKLEAVGQLAAGIAHEINTPLQYVGDSVHFLRDSFSDLLSVTSSFRRCVDTLAAIPGHEALIGEVERAAEEGDLAYLEESVPRGLDRALQGLEHVSKIVRALKEFAHPGQKERMPGDINRALENALIVSRNEYKFVAEVETDLGELPPVLCDLSELNQVFLNLIINAAHAIGDTVSGSDRKGIIRVITQRIGDEVRISIADTGGGIPAGIRERIFDPFFTTKPVGKGTGQGLAIARSIVVDRHGGRLSFESGPDSGTVFHIDLAIERTEKAAVESAA
ncbi:MAG TPA: ATP-binding protein [Kofleriaceae bacterium]|nr:ATP-binding protein [Kofleriaceae bacterium]